MPRRPKNSNEIRSPLTRVTFPATITVLVIPGLIIAALLYQPPLGG